MRRVLSASLAQPIVVLALTAAFAIAGVVAFLHLPIEAFPELADPQVQVITLFPSHAAEEVERQVTLPVEQQMNGLPGLTRMHSFSLFGLSFVVLTFDDGTDLYFARQQASERLAQVDVPEGVKPTLGPLSTPTGEIYRYTLVGAFPRRGVVTRDREPEAVEGIVLMRRGENPSVVLDALHAKVEQLNHGILPPGVRIDTFYDRARLVRRTLTTVTHNLVLGALLVVLVVGVFLMSLRAALVVALVIPLSLLGSFLYLKLRGLSANLLSLGAVDFGIIVDGAVIMVEHVARRLARNGSGSSPRHARAVVLEAAEEVARPTLFALCIIIVAYLPIFSLQRVEGRIFAPMANTVCAALVAALAFSFTLVPLLGYLLLRRNAGGGEETPVERAALGAYRPALGWALDHRRAVLGATLAVLALGLWLFARLGTEFLPELNEGALYVTFTLPPSIPLSEASRAMVPRITDLFLYFPEVKSVLSQLGGPDDGTDWSTPNNLEYFVDLKPREEWSRGMTADRLVTEMRVRLADIPGIEFNFSQPIKDNIEENISGMNGQIAIKLFGNDLAAMRRAAEDVRRVLATVPGVADLAIVQSAELPQVHIVVDRQAIARYGLNVADVQEVVETAIGGAAATALWEGERHVH